MAILYLDGPRLKNCIIVAAQRVLESQERLNRMNVFPIPDGDTGSNMALTLKCIAEGAINAGEMNLSQLSAHMAESALMGSCGNSGAILAQFFQGLAGAFSHCTRVDPKAFAHAVKRGVETAESALSQPVEGTIITVMRDWALFIVDQSSRTTDFVDLFHQGLEVAKASLAGTPQLLKVLARAHVVDAGAQGFVYMLEGVAHYMKTGQLQWTPVADDRAPERAEVSVNVDHIRFQFCTECLVDGEDLDIKTIRASLKDLGDSMIVAGGPRKIRIHLHTNHPEELYQRAARFGSVSRQKAEDMRAQHSREYGTEASIALIADSSCDLPTDYLIKNKIRLVPVRVTVGNQVFLDRVNITSEEVYRIMTQSETRISTSQPTTGAFSQAFKMAAETHKQAIAITVSSKVSGSHQACLTAARSVENLEIRVIDSGNTAGGLGLLVAVAAEAIAKGCNMAEVEKIVGDARPHTRLFAAFETMKYMVRGGRVSRFKGWMARVLNRTPILTFDLEGGVRAPASGKPGLSCWKKMLKLILKECQKLEEPRFIISHARAEEAALWFEDQLKQHFNLQHVPILPVSPTIGAHAGPGALGVALTGQPKPPPP